jgi:hypothetical protein
MEAIFPLALVLITSTGAFLLGTRGGRLHAGALRIAAGRALETLGLVLAFFLVNLGLGIALVLVARGLTGAFISLYGDAEWTLLGLSLVQALAFREWRATPPGGRPAPPATGP